MNWFYAQAGQPVGPVTDAEFNNLVATGVIQASTLVWFEGMANWQPYSTLQQPAPAAVPSDGAAPPTGVVCAECGRTFAPDQVVRFGSTPVCAECKPLFLQKLREGAPVAFQGPQYGGFWIRFVAKVIDGLILGVLTVPVTILFGGQLFVGMTPGAMPNWRAFIFSQIWLTLYSVVVKMLYTWLFVGRYGATPGKMVFGLKVVTPEGGKVSYTRAFARFWAEIVTGLTCLIGYIIAGFDDQRRALHDHICNTRVVRK
jgi:uncharacterized RDD family membrane protein YckC